MKKLFAIALALVLCLGMFATATAEAAPVKVALMMPVSTHAWVSGIAYNAEVYAEELQAAGTIEYKMYTSSNAEEMTAQIDEAMLWGAQAMVVAPQWTGMEAPVQAAINEGLTVVAFDMDIAAEGIYKVTGDNESMGVGGAKFIVDKMGTEGLVVVLRNTGSGSVDELRVKGFKETMAQIAPNVQFVEYDTGTFTAEDGLKTMADALTANAKIDAVFSLDDETSIGCLQAIDEAGRTEIKAITGGGGCQKYFKIIEAKADEIGAASALYSPLMVKDCIDVAVAVVNGAAAEAVTVIPSQIVSAENVAEYLDPNNTIY